MIQSGQQPPPTRQGAKTEPGRGVDLIQDVCLTKWCIYQLNLQSEGYTAFLDIIAYLENII